MLHTQYQSFIRAIFILILILLKCARNVTKVVHVYTCGYACCVCTIKKWMANSKGLRAHLFPRFCVCGGPRVPGPGAGAAPPGAGGGIAVQLVAGLLHRHRLAYVLQYHPHYGHSSLLAAKIKCCDD